MSQRAEKYSRQLGIRMDKLEDRMDKLEAKQLTSDRFGDALRAVQQLDASTAARQYRQTCDRARDAELRARAWKLNAILTLILAALIAGVALVITAKAAATEGPTTPPEEAPTISNDGHLLGDDTPAQEPLLLDQAHVLEGVTITHYDICKQCCGKVDGITASGTHATPYSTVAVDPSVIPLGAELLVDYGDGAGLRRYRAEDTGGAIKGNRIDLCVSSHAEALQLGKRTATVYWLDEEVD